MSERMTILIVGHGSRDDSSNREFEDLIDRYRERRNGVRVTHGYIELADPLLKTALEEAAQDSDRVVVLPLFLFSAGHVKNDIPLALDQARRASPKVEFRAAESLGVHPFMSEILFERAASTDPSLAETAERTAVVVVSRGSSDPNANGDFCKLVRLFAEGRGFSCVLPCFIGITQPLVDETLDLAARTRPERLLVMPYFLFAGRLISRLKDRIQTLSHEYPWIKTTMAPHLGIHSRLLDLVDERLLGAMEGRASLPCDTCQ